MHPAPVLCVFAFLCSSILLNTIHSRVPEAYMDEVFHQPQTVKYCQGNYRAWDSKITTLPGLYIIASLHARLLSLAGIDAGQQCEDLKYLRTINVALGSICVALFYSIVEILHPRASTLQHTVKTLVLATFPLHFFYQFLYYTDIASTLCVLYMYLWTLKRYFKAAAFFGVLSILMRQTNVIWVAFCMGVAILERFRPQLQRAASEDDVPVLSELARVLSLIRINLASVVMENIGFLVVMLGFAVFVVVNGGIVVGDRTAHAAVFHFPMFLYFGLFAACFLGLNVVRPAFQAAYNMMSGGGALVANFACALMAFGIRRFTFEHPYLLADNRHYTFYIWKNFFRRHYMARYALIPPYVLSWGGIWQLLGRTTLYTWRLGYLACVAALVISTPLLEFRYFVLPYLFLQMHFMQAKPAFFIWDVMVNLAVNAFTIIVFVTRTFPYGDGTSVGRFMW